MSARRAGLPAALLFSTSLVVVGGATCGDDKSQLNTAQMLRHQRRCAEQVVALDLDGANASCALCLDFDERNAECLFNGGLVKWQRGDVAGARVLIVRALRENNDLGQAHNALGRMSLDDGDIDAAIDHFEHAVEIDPHFVPGHQNLGLAFLRKGMRQTAHGEDPTASFDRAELEYRKLFEIVPDDVVAARDMGFLMTLKADRAPRERQGRLLKDAEGYWVRCLVLDPRSKECHGNLAHLFSTTGRRDEALAHAEACVAIDPADPICGAELARARAP